MRKTSLAATLLTAAVLLTGCGSRPPALVLRLVELDFPVDLVPVFAVVGHGRFYQPGGDLQVLSRLGHGPIVVPDGGNDLPDIQAAAQQAGPAAARAVEELDERVCVVTQPLLNIALGQGAFLDACPARPLRQPPPDARR